MATLELSLPESLKSFVEEQASRGGHGSPSDYVRFLIREAQKHEVQTRLESLLLEGLDSDEKIEVSEDLWEEMRRRYDENHRTVDSP